MTAIKTEILEIVPVLPSQNIERDLAWYNKFAGFQKIGGDHMYAIMKREQLCIHLQWHADNDDDPLLGGSVIKIFVKNIQPIFDEFVERGTVAKDKLQLKTPWGTNEFGFYDLNQNAVFFVQDV